MSCEEILPKFEIDIVIKEVTIRTIESERSLVEDFLKVDLEFLGRKIEVVEQKEKESSISLANGCHSVDFCFKLKNEENDSSNEEFTFKLLGDPIIVNFLKLSNNRKSLDTRKSLKKLKDVKQKITQFASGTINLLQHLKRFQKDGMKIFHVTLQPIGDEDFDICVQYEIQFLNPPVINSTLSASISQFYNLPLDEKEKIEVAFHFPSDEGKFQTVFLHPEPKVSDDEFGGFLMDDSLKNLPVDLEISKQIYCYENIQSIAGFEFLADLITNNRKLLLEIRWRKQVFMSFLDLQVFNYEGVDRVSFLVPLYHRNKKALVEQFQQELCAFPEEEIPAKKGKEKRSSKKSEETNDAELIPLILEEMHVMMSVQLKIAEPLTPETPLEDLKNILNQQVPFIEEFSLKDQILEKNEKDFEKVIKSISRKMEKFIDDNPELNCYNIEQKIKRMIENGELYDKKILKEVLKDLIGNKLSVGKKTDTNHEFKIFMIDVFKILNQDILKILSKKYEKECLEPFEPMKTELRKVQIEEWILMGQVDIAEETLRKHLDYNETPEILMEFSVFLLRIGKLQECEEKVLKYLKLNHDETFGFYILAYLMIHRGRVDIATLAVKILTKLQPHNVEFWILLMMLYERSQDKCGVNYCMIQIHGKKFSVIRGIEPESLVLPEHETEDEISKIINYQLKLNLQYFVELTRKFVEISLLQLQKDFDNLELNFIDAMQKGNFDDAVKILSNTEITDENEMMLRTMRGNLFFTSGDKWKGICEYEIAYNISLKTSRQFPHLPAFRCGDWYLKETDNLPKARRFFHHCCKTSPTFHSWMGLGIVCFRETNFFDAEKYFGEANKIYKKSCDNWIYLALTNFKLQRHEMFEQCFLTARKFPVENSQLMDEAEKILDF